MSMRLFLIRHGETWWNEARKFQGISDIELSPQGLMQAQKLAASLKSEVVAKIYTSPLKRAWQTAAEIAKYHPCPLVVLDDLRELDQGYLEGLTGQDLRRDYADFFIQWLRDPANLKLPGGESLQELQQRAWGAIEKIKEDHPEDTVIVVAHNFVNLVIFCRILGMPLNNFRRWRQDPAAKNLIEVSGAKVVIHLINDTCHLRNCKKV